MMQRIGGYVATHLEVAHNDLCLFERGVDECAPREIWFGQSTFIKIRPEECFALEIALFLLHYT